MDQLYLKNLAPRTHASPLKHRDTSTALQLSQSLGEPFLPADFELNFIAQQGPARI